MEEKDSGLAAYCGLPYRPYPAVEGCAVVAQHLQSAHRGEGGHDAGGRARGHAVRSRRHLGLNHGARQLDTVASTIELLPDIVEGRQRSL